jgi:exodeoxyribonuclease V alpha subunit
MGEVFFMENDTSYVFEGFVKKIKYENEDNFFILEVQNLEKEDYILQGYAQNLRAGDYFNAEGSWIFKKGKQQFNALCINILEPTEEECILEYLSSGIIKGIGKTSAIKIVEVFGVDSLKVIANKPEQLLRLPKIGQKTITKIINSWNEVKPSEQIVSELIKLGFKNFEAIKIYKVFGLEAMSILQTFPYNISTKIKTIGFKNVDYVVLRMGFPENSNIRINATINYFMQEIQQGGDCIVPKNVIIDFVFKYLKTIERENILEALDNGIKKSLFHTIMQNNIEHIQTEYMFNQEMELAKRLYQLKSYKNVVLPKIEQITFIEKRIPFTDEQAFAIKGALNNKVSVVTGKPGVGKTTVVNEVIKQFEALNKDVLLCAPTGKAAQKMTESSGKPASTIHRLLEFNPMKDGFSVTDDNPLELDVIIIDEASMIDIYLMVHLFRALPIASQIVIIGDIGQLPSVNAGATLRDIIFSNKIPVFRIEKIMRQKGSSSIVTNAHSIDKGIFNYLPNYNKGVLEDFYFLPTTSDEETLSKMRFIIEKKVKQSFKFKPKKDVQVLSATHQGELGTESLNTILQNILNKNDDFDSIKKGHFKYKKDDKVIQIVNNYEKDIFNGDTGVIDCINENGVYIIFDNGKEAEYTKREMDELLPSYVITGHKSQGSEYPVVIIPLPQIYTQVIDRSWIYTTITRGKSFVIVVGSKDVLERGIKSEKSRHRSTDLQSKIIEIFEIFDN